AAKKSLFCFHGPAPGQSKHGHQSDHCRHPPVIDRPCEQTSPLPQVQLPCLQRIRTGKRGKRTLARRGISFDRFSDGRKGRSAESQDGKTFFTRATCKPRLVFSRKRMMETVRFLSSDDLAGRGFGTPGLDKAADKIAKQFRGGRSHPCRGLGRWLLLDLGR